MGLALVHFQKDNKKSWGVVKGDCVLEIGEFNSFSELLEKRKSFDLDNLSTLSLDQLEILNPITDATKITCQGVNYADHRQDGGYGAQKPAYNMIFSKSLSSLTGPYASIIKPKHVQLLDYEIELGLIIGKNISAQVEVTDDNLHEYVAGLVIVNDISARDIQIPEEQWEKGKSYRTFCPVGPILYLIDKKDVPLLHNLELKLWVNGELRQHNNTKNLLYKPSETLSELSGVMNFKLGDLLLTGTPAGVAVTAPPAIVQNLLSLFLTPEKKMHLFVKNQKNNSKYLQNDDVIRASIKHPQSDIDLGMQINVVEFE